MKIKIIDKCCNEFHEIEIKNSDLSILTYGDSIKIAPAKEGHSIIIHHDLTIEYIKS